MAIVKTAEMTGTQPVVNPDQAGEVYEMVFKIDPAVTPVSSGDFVQLMQVPADCILSDITLGAPATLGAVTVAAGIADAAATTALATTYIAAGTITTTVPVHANATILGDTPLSNPTANQRIVTLAIAAANLAAVLYAKVSYRAARYGR
jgi:hypothetical protein